jgi:uncharacterized protein (DUF1786 family)
VPSGTKVVAGEIDRAGVQGLAVVMEGSLMGGGANASAMRRLVARGLPFYATPSAAGSFDDDLGAVKAMGVTVVGPEDVGGLIEAGAMRVLSGDIRFPELLEALRLVGESALLDGCAVAVQDHGNAPPGESDRTFRFEKMAATLAESRHLSAFFHRRDEIPEYFTRMRAVAGLVDADTPLVVGDTGPAALWGASLAASKAPCLAINFGNGHTLMAFVDEECLDGLFEHHTSMIDPSKMEAFIRRFAAGELENSEVFADGGHGTLKVSRPFDLAEVEIVATGPRRGSFASMGLTMTEASLHGDMMLTGSYGLLQGYLARQ